MNTPARSLVLALCLFLSALVSQAHAQVQRYNREQVRRQLDELTLNPQPQKIEVQGELEPGSPQEKLVRYYLEVIHPKLEEMDVIDRRAGAIHLLRDSGSELNKEEKLKWKAEYDSLVNKSSEFAVDVELAAQIKTFGQMAEGLTGDLPDFARRFAKTWDLNHFPPHMLQKLTDAEVKTTDYEQSMVDTKAMKTMSIIRAGVPKIVSQYKSKKITFAEAQKQLNHLSSNYGSRYLGYETAQKSGHLINEAAIARSELAKEKGFKNWAAYRLENTGEGYDEAYRGPENQSQFLRDWISQLRPVVQQYYQKRLKELGLEKVKDTIKANHLGLLSPPDLSMLQDHFPAPTLTTTWEQLMRESGFQDDMMSQVVVDADERENKNGSGAYMMPLFTPTPEVQIIDAKTLNFSHNGILRRGFIYILQTFRGAGLRDFETMLHEGMGHAFEYLLKDKFIYRPEGYGSVEVPSTTAEYFVQDPKFLNDRAMHVMGRKPSIKQITEWVKGHQAGEALALLDRAQSALYDILIWDYDYSAPGAKTYMERVLEVSEEIEQMAETFPMLDLPIPFGYFYVSSSHFVSGDVRNIGYSYASIASHMMADHISNELEKRTGRRSWYKQPLLAEIITEQFYKQGWKDLFPTNIEKITGRKFDMAAVLQEMTKTLGCEAALTAKAN